MKLISWNVNGLRACMNKGFLDFFKTIDADVFCLQETKMQPGQAEVPTEGYHQYWYSAEKKGYSGTAVFSKEEPLSVHYDIDSPQHTGEGRAITLEYPGFYLVNLYSPNSQQELARLSYRMEWQDALLRYTMELRSRKPVVLCGDLNVAHQEIDLKNPKPNMGSAGFSAEEREKFTQLLESGFIDTFRYQHPDLEGAYTWWSYQFRARSRNAGWRIDYFLVSEELRECIDTSLIFSEVQGSDHCPVGLWLKPAP